MQDYSQDAKEWKGISDVFQEKGIHAFDIGKAQNNDATPEELLRDFDELLRFWRYSQNKIVFGEYRSKKRKIRACLQSSDLTTKFDEFETIFKRHCIGNGSIEPTLIEILKKEFGDTDTTPPPPPPPVRRCPKCNCILGDDRICPKCDIITPPPPGSDALDIVSIFIAPALCAIASGIAFLLLILCKLNIFQIWLIASAFLVTDLFIARLLTAKFNIVHGSVHFGKALSLSLVYEIFACWIFSSYGGIWYYSLPVVFIPFLVTAKSFTFIREDHAKSKFAHSFALFILGLSLIPFLATGGFFAYNALINSRQSPATEQPLAPAQSPATEQLLAPAQSPVTEQLLAPSQSPVTPASQLPAIVVEHALPGNVKLAMVKVEAGIFEMSAKDGENERGEVPHRVTLTRDFYVGRTEVTQAQWRAVMGNNPSYYKGDDRPVENVSWNDAMKFCDKLNSMGLSPSGWKFTLPTETQWEYAARGGKKSRGYKYSGSNDINEVAWYGKNSERMTHAVGGKKANELGLYDMSGNVREWCLDNWNNDSSKAVPEFTRCNDGGVALRVNRGGSWSCVAAYCRSVLRHWFGPNIRNDDLGFRLALVPTGEQTSAATENNVKELCRKGEEHFDRKEYSQAVRCFQKAASQGNADAQFKLGNCYYLTQDYVRAAEWYQKAADQGNDCAQTNLGYCYECGTGVPKDYA